MILNFLFLFFFFLFFFLQLAASFQLLTCLLNWASRRSPSPTHNTGTTCVKWGWRTWQNGDTHTHKHTTPPSCPASPPPPADPLLGLTSKFRWLVAMVTAGEWGLFALFLLSSLKPCHYPYSTGTRVYLRAPACLIVRLFFVRPPVCLSVSCPPPPRLLSSLFFSLPSRSVHHSSITHSFATSASFSRAQLDHCMRPYTLCSALKLPPHTHTHTNTHTYEYTNRDTMRPSSFRLVIHTPDSVHQPLCRACVMWLNIHITCKNVQGNKLDDNNMLSTLGGTLLTSAGQGVNITKYLFSNGWNKWSKADWWQVEAETANAWDKRTNWYSASTIYHHKTCRY